MPLILVDMFKKLDLTQINQIWKIKLIRLTKKIPDASGLVKKVDYNAKITEIEGKIPSITGLATSTALILITIEMKFLMLVT